MGCNKRRIVGGLIAVSVAWGFGPARAEDSESKRTLDMPAEDRATIDTFLGKGIVGKPVPAGPIGDPLKYVQLGEDATYAVQITSGDHKGRTIDQSVERVNRESGETTWKVTAGETDVVVYTLDKDGNLLFVSHAEPDKGLDGHYSPHPPLLIRGMEPGATHKADFEVKVYYLDQPGKLKHQGSLALKLSYLGMFEINLPSGKQEAALIKSAYVGKIGPGKVDDTQYRFFVENFGVVAMVERKDISAFLLYNDEEKVGKLLIKQLQK